MNKQTEEQARKTLLEMTEKQKLVFTKRGNDSIQKALTYVKNLGRTQLLIPDQGGWMTYKPLGEEEGYTIEVFSTKDGVFKAEELPQVEQGHAALLINSMPAYTFTLAMQDIYRHCQEHDILLINDATANIGRLEAKIGDIIIGSFGRWKPLSVGKGGFIASNYDLPFEDAMLDYEALEESLRTLPERLETNRQRREELKTQLEGYTLLRAQDQGLNLIARYSSEEEKEKLINIAQKNTIEITECPREIRVLKPAISFEIKREL